MNKPLPFIFLFFILTNLLFVACKKNESLVEVYSPEDLDTEKIIVLGSSTAAGMGASIRDSAWVNRLQAKLIGDHKKVKVINLACGAYTTYQILPSNSVIIAQKPVPDTARNITKALSFKPSLVLINMPSNDIATGYSDDEILDNYKSITAILDIEHIPYILTGTQPRNFLSEQQRLRLKTLNSKLQLLYNNSLNDYLEDLSTTTWGIRDEYSAGDGIHLNNKGHYIIYQSFANHQIFKKVFKY
jgi:acyl-CoA thioesterase-1